MQAGVAHSEDGSGRAAVRTGTGFGCVCERERRGIDDTVVTDQRYRDLHRLPHPPPALAERRDVWDDAQHALATPLEEISCLLIIQSVTAC